MSQSGVLARARSREESPKWTTSIDRSTSSTPNPGGLGNPRSRRSRNLCGAGDGFPELGFEAIGVFHRLNVHLGVERDDVFTGKVPLGTQRVDGGGRNPSVV